MPRDTPKKTPRLPNEIILLIIDEVLIQQLPGPAINMIRRQMRLYNGASKCRDFPANKFRDLVIRTMVNHRKQEYKQLVVRLLLTSQTFKEQVKRTTARLEKAALAQRCSISNAMTGFVSDSNPWTDRWNTEARAWMREQLSREEQIAFDWLAAVFHARGAPKASINS